MKNLYVQSDRHLHKCNRSKRAYAFDESFKQLDLFTNSSCAVRRKPYSPSQPHTTCVRRRTADGLPPLGRCGLFFVLRVLSCVFCLACFVLRLLSCVGGLSLSLRCTVAAHALSNALELTSMVTRLGPSFAAQADPHLTKAAKCGDCAQSGPIGGGTGVRSVAGALPNVIVISQRCTSPTN